MALPDSSLSMVCAEIAQFVRNGVNAAANHINVHIGAPADIVGNDSEHRINLFFYRFEPGGFHADAHPNDPWRVRLFCLISVFGIDEDGVPAGENDLRLLGAVLRIFRETPVLAAGDVNEEQVRLQVVFSPVTDDQINQIWSTQGDTVYRPSVIYEMALAPIMPSTRRVEPALVGAIGGQARAAASGRFAAFSGTASGPRPPFSRVDIDNPQWAPSICWLYQDKCVHTLSFDINGPEFGAFIPAIWLAGDPNENVDLIWEIWDSNGWRPAGAVVMAAPFNTAIDPDNIPAAIPDVFPLGLSLPMTIPADENAAQGVLYAVRNVGIAGRPPVEIRSNPLLISLYRTL